MAAYPHIDIVMRGEPEATVMELTGLLADAPLQTRRGFLDDVLQPVLGITYRREGKVTVNPDRPLIPNLDDLPMAASAYYGEIIRRASEQTRGLRYLSVEEHVHVEAGRGCPFPCTFCSNVYLWRRRYRLKSPERIVAEMRLYHEEYGARQFLLHQQLFTVNKAKTRAFCETLIAADLPVEWSCFTRSDCVDPEMLTLMKRSGCNTVLFGVESGAQEIQDVVRKKTDVNRVSEQIALTMKHGIKPQLSYILGFPEETPENLQATVDMYFRYKFADGVESQLGLLVPAGGTEVLTQNLNDLAFDGVQTTTWYTRFFDDTGYDEMGSLPLVFPHNHYVKSTQNPRELLLFVKCFDMAASYLTRACQYAVTRGLLGMPFQAWEQYQQWRQGLDPAQTRARGWGGRLTWDTPVAAIIRDFAQFLSEVIAPTDNDPAVLASLVSYEEAAALVNLRLREANWDQLCAAVPPGDDSNPVTPEHQQLDFATSYALDALEAHLDGNPLPPAATHANTYTAAGDSQLRLVTVSDGGTVRRRFPVFRQIEF
ncbi:B12-binding domain-containing radical SAM protein (plasmid) [Streptomyces sp. NBC_01724]|uniref:B12-binding domain-containing radical SAM protein n=1 Tax=Streptomyces sp. NBC_01724 TaxID=2975922 RepID=UPI002E32AEA6|nr:radical SAM protein [Streptomyces sp. NBC_01724]